MADFTAVISNGMASIRSSATAAAGGVDKLMGSLTKTGQAGAKEMTKLGAAITKMGGPIGEIGGKLFGGAGMGGGIGRLAVAATLAGVAFKGISAAMDASRQRTEALVDAVDKLGTALKGANQAKEDFAAGAEETGRTKAVAENLFGFKAGDIAESLSREFKVELGDVFKAMAGSGGIPRAERMGVLRTALGVAATGEASAAEAVSKLADRGMRAKVMSAGNVSIGGIKVSDERARSASLLMRMRGAGGAGAYNEALVTVGGRQGAAGDQLAPVAEAGSLTTSAQIDAFESGATAAAKRKAAAAAANPTAEALRKFAEAQQKEIDKHRLAAREHAKKAEEYSVNLAAKSWELILMAIEESQARKGENAFGAAVNGTSEQ